MGETDEHRGLETTMSNMNELQSIFTLLGMNIKLCPKFSASEPAIKAVDYDDPQFREIEVQNHVGLSIKKKSATKKCSLWKKRENIKRNLPGDKKYVKKGCEEFDPNCKVNQRCENVRFKQSGLLQDFKVNLIECSSDGTLKEDAMSKTYAAKGDNVNKCSKCNKRFSSRRYMLKHFRRMHKNKILPQKKGTVTKVQHQEVHIRKKESEGGTKLEVLSNDILAKRKECDDSDISVNLNHSLSMHKMRVHECQTYEPIVCGDCDLSFKYKSSLRKHRSSVHEGKKYGCGVCDKITAYRDGMIRHCNSSGHDRDLIYLRVDFP